MRALILLTTGLLLAAAPALAADWVVDAGKSHLGFSGVQAGTPFTGSFKTFVATISFDPAHPEAGHASVVIDMASAATGDPQKDEALPTADWFDAGKFPKATFEATGFKPKGGDAYEAVGTLAIRDVKLPVTLPFTLVVAGDTAHAVGRMELLRSKFGVGQGEWKSPQWVAFEVGVDVDLTAAKKG